LDMAGEALKRRRLGYLLYAKPGQKL